MTQLITMIEYGDVRLFKWNKIGQILLKLSGFVVLKNIYATNIQ